MTTLWSRLALLVVLLWTLLPIYWFLKISLLTPDEIARFPPPLYPLEPTPAAFLNIFGFDYTLAAVAAASTMVERTPDIAAAAIRALVATQTALRQDPALAGKVGRALFPAQEAALIGDIVARDLPFYHAPISEQAFAAMSQFARDVGILKGHPEYDDVVATDFRHLWTG